MKVLLEVCIDSVESARAAQAGGADRLEVCSSLSAGGTTPSAGLVERCVADVGLPVMMMIRPHDGGFVYQDDDLQTMLGNIRVAHSLGVQGVVFGALAENRQIHLEHCRRLLAAAAPLETTFHRAFDLVADPIDAVDQLMELGFTRVLTSGQAATAEAGSPLIRQLCQRAEQRLEILAGAGITAQNVQPIVAATGVREVHASASLPTPGQSQGEVTFGADRRVTSAEVVQAIRRSLEGAT